MPLPETNLLLEIILLLRRILLMEIKSVYVATPPGMFWRPILA
jgi:hypothetical protein